MGVLSLAIFATTAQAQTHRLKIGDVVRIAVTVNSTAKDYSGDFLVQSDGAIYGIAFGSLHVADLTLAEAQQKTRDAMKRLVNPNEVLVTLKSEVVRKVFIVGAPGGGPATGSVEIVDKLTLRQALAGIVSFKDADLLEARVYRSGKEVKTVNLGQLLNGNADQDTLLQPDDVISIASVATVRVWVTGSVRTPGPEQLPQNASVDQAIAQAGGAAITDSKDALASRGEYRVILRRGTTITEFPLMKAGEAPPVAVEPGDTITVEPPMRDRIVVTGEVRNPGEFFAKPGTSLLSVLAQAGGPTQDGSASNTIVYRDGEPIFVNADTNLDPKTGVQFVVKEGDTVVVRKNDRVVYVFGEVQHQGKFTVPVGKPFRVTDALALSGGLSTTGTLRRVYLARPGPDGHFTITRFNLDEFIKDGKQESNPTVEPNDVLLFGQPKPTLLTSVTQVIGSLLFINSIAGSAGIRTVGN